MVTSYAGWGVLLSFEQLVFDIILRHFKEVEVISVSCTANQNQRAENEKKKKGSRHTSSIFDWFTTSTDVRLIVDVHS